MPRPSALPEWSTSPGPNAGIVEPSLAKKQAGWDTGERPPAQYWNWWKNLVYLWLQWFDSLFTTGGGYRVPSGQVIAYATTQNRSLIVGPAEMIPGAYNPHVSANLVNSGTEWGIADWTLPSLNGSFIGLRRVANDNLASLRGSFRLPVGATITGLSLIVHRASTATNIEDVEVSVGRYQPSGVGYATYGATFGPVLEQIIQIGTGNLNAGSTIAIPMNGNNLVAVQDSVYMFDLMFEGGSAAAQPLHVCGLRVDYTFTQISQ